MLTVADRGGGKKDQKSADVICEGSHIRTINGSAFIQFTIIK